jgi:hypothetical protein
VPLIGLRNGYVRGVQSFTAFVLSNELRDRSWPKADFLAHKADFCI